MVEARNRRVPTDASDKNPGLRPGAQAKICVPLSLSAIASVTTVCRIGSLFATTSFSDMAGFGEARLRFCQGYGGQAGVTDLGDKITVTLIIGLGITNVMIG